MCRAINHCNKQRWQEQTFKVPLRFMFHYCITNEDGCKTANLPVVFDLWKAQPAAARKDSQCQTKAHLASSLSCHARVRLCESL